MSQGPVLPPANWHIRDCLCDQTRLGRPKFLNFRRYRWLSCLFLWLSSAVRPVSGFVFLWLFLCAKSFLYPSSRYAPSTVTRVYPGPSIPGPPVYLGPVHARRKSASRVASGPGSRVRLDLGCTMAGERPHISEKPCLAEHALEDLPNTGHAFMRGVSKTRTLRGVRRRGGGGWGQDGGAEVMDGPASRRFFACTEQAKHPLETSALQCKSSA